MTPLVSAAEAPPADLPVCCPPTATCPFRAHVFEAEGAPEMPEAFASLTGPKHYPLTEN